MESRGKIHECAAKTAKIHNVSIDEVYDAIRDSKDHNKDLNDPYQIRVGDVGTYTRGGRVGRQYWDGFVVTKIVVPGKKIEVEFDEPILVGDEKALSKPYETHPHLVTWYTPEEYKYRTLEYRKPGRWMFKGVPAKKMWGLVSIGEKRTEVEQGYF